jgi:DNA-directed RNA polymerase specialized sigma24 family protein
VVLSGRKVKVLFEHGIADFGPAIARVAASFEANPAIREELIQDIGLAIWRSIERFSGSGTLKGFVLSIAHTKSVDHVAKEAF